MIVFIKLLLAHLFGDFVLQPNAWVKDKEQKKHRSLYLLFHTVLHGLLALILVWKIDFAFYAALLALIHGAVDLMKLQFQTDKTKRGWFIADQLLHLLVIAAVALLYNQTDIGNYEIDDRFWIYFAAVLLLTTPASIIIKNVISIWTPTESDTAGTDLQNAGKYIGILERLFVFFFIVTGNFTSIGFLMAAKSIFRFGDLTKSNDRKLTEYVLIGTFMSFGAAIGTGFLVKYALTLLC
ncbi:MAG: DUF3307 domain-containing protein [Flavobacterium sp.]|nr:MAG: DUF3307 domain-containing protein [Flavobacterium sp.]